MLRQAPRLRGGQATNNLHGRCLADAIEDGARDVTKVVALMVAYGFTTPIQQRDYLNGVFGTSFQTLEEVRDFNLQAISDAFDKNQNGYVCAHDLRGTRASNDDPLFEFTWFGVSDDKLR